MDNWAEGRGWASGITGSATAKIPDISPTVMILSVVAVGLVVAILVNRK